MRTNKIIIAGMLLAAATAGFAADTPESHQGLLAYRVAVFEEKSCGAVSVVSQQSVIAAQGTTVPVRVGMQTTFPVACSDNQGKTIACGDEWAATKQLSMNLHSTVRDGLVETDFEIRGGAAKGPRDIEPILLLSQGRWQTAPGDTVEEAVALPVPGLTEAIHYRVQVSAQAL